MIFINGLNERSLGRVQAIDDGVAIARNAGMMPSKAPQMMVASA